MVNKTMGAVLLVVVWALVHVFAAGQEKGPVKLPEADKIAVQKAGANIQARTQDYSKAQEAILGSKALDCVTAVQLVSQMRQSAYEVRGALSRLENARVSACARLKIDPDKWELDNKYEALVPKE